MRVDGLGLPRVGCLLLCVGGSFHFLGCMTHCGRMTLHPTYKVQLASLTYQFQTAEAGAPLEKTGIYRSDGLARLRDFAGWMGLPSFVGLCYLSGRHPNPSH
jgi:hypothetical protein